MRKQIILFLLSGILLMTLLGGCRLYTDTEPDCTDEQDTVRRLHLENCRLMDENGNTVQLTGMSSHGLLWYPEYTNAGALQTIKSYGANTFRIAVYADDINGGYVQQKEETMRLTYMAIENALSLDMYVIVDWHVLQDQNPLVNQDNAAAFFEEIASHYGDCPNLLYEICNEPNGNTSWYDISTYANGIIPIIRSYAPNAIIIVGTPNYSYSVEDVIGNPLDYENIMYSFHYYAGMHGEGYNEIFNRCSKANIPIFVTEWGIGYDVNGQAAVSQGEQFAKVLQRRGISWIAWSLCNKDEIHSAIRSDCDKFSDWVSDDLTEVGKVFFEAFSG